MFSLSGEKMSLTGLKVLIYFGNYPGGLVKQLGNKSPFGGKEER